MRIVDAHLHVWELGRFAYPWLTPNAPALYRDYTIHKALETISANGVYGAVLVEANNSLEEAHWLLELAEQHEEILGVIGWCDLTSLTLERDLEPLARHPKFKGVRPTLPTSDANWNPPHAALEILEAFHLSCDLLIQGRLPEGLASWAAQHPNLRFVLDHFGSSAISLQGHSAWASALEAFAVQPNVNLKFSGCFTAAETKPLSAIALETYVQTAIRMFKPSRLMFGSDWPVCTLACQYGETLELLGRAAHLGFSANKQLLSDTAREFYSLNLKTLKS